MLHDRSKQLYKSGHTIDSPLCMYKYYYSLSFSFALNALLYCTIHDMFISIDSDLMCVVYTIPSSSCCPSCMYDLLDEILM